VSAVAFYSHGPPQDYCFLNDCPVTKACTIGIRNSSSFWQKGTLEDQVFLVSGRRDAKEQPL
jgi:hypothetical protein